MPVATIRPTEEQCLQCRAEGHRWDTIQPLVKRRSMFSQTRESHCERCDSGKTEVFDVNGNCQGRNYHPSKEYEMYTGITRADARAVQMGTNVVVWKK